MKTLIKLVIAALVVHATWRAGTVFWRYYSSRTGSQQTAQFVGQRSRMASSTTRCWKLAQRAARLPLDPDDASTVRRAGQPHAHRCDATPSRSSSLPRYFYPWEFKVNVDVLTLSSVASRRAARILLIRL